MVQKAMLQVGKHPKDRLCKKEVGVGEEELLRFVLSVHGVLEVHLAGNAVFEGAAPWAEVAEAPMTELFALPAYRDCLGAGRESLLGLTKGDKATYFQLAQHHLQLTAVTALMLALRYKPARPAALFDAKGLDAFFVPLHSHPLLSQAQVDGVTKGSLHPLLFALVPDSHRGIEARGPSL